MPYPFVGSVEDLTHTFASPTGCSPSSGRPASDVRGVYYGLFVIIYIYRYVVGWMVAAAETGGLAKGFIAECLGPPWHRTRPAHLARRPWHVDDVQAGRPTAARPRCGPQPLPSARVQRQPLSRGELQDAQVLPRLPRPIRIDSRRPRVLHSVLKHYNHVHRHSGIGLHTPASVHYDTAATIRDQRTEILDAAYAANPVRFGYRRPNPTVHHRLNQRTVPRSTHQERMTSCLIGLDKLGVHSTPPTGTALEMPTLRHLLLHTYAGTAVCCGSAKLERLPT